MPDGELSAVADAGKLQDKAVLAAQARRMLKDPRSRALFDGFGAQWLGVDKLAGKTFDTEKFPQMTAKMRLAMYDEARLFFQEILRDNLRLITSSTATPPTSTRGWRPSMGWSKPFAASRCDV